MSERQAVYEYIREQYDIQIIPTFICQKLDNIFNGTFRGMSVAIPPSHLLDMWKRKIHMLNELAEKNKTRGRTMSTEQRISYDLSVLVNKYDSYLRWLERQKIIEAEMKNNKSQNLVGKTIGYNNQSLQTDECNDISTLVDDIFG